MSETNTAADRLLRIVREVSEAPDQVLVKAWSKALRIESENKLDVFRGILSLAELVNEVESVVVRHGGPATKLYQRSFDAVRHMLMVNIDGHKHQMGRILTPEVVNDLEHCAAAYSVIDTEAPIASEQIQDIRQRIDELFQDVTDSKLPPELRIQILDLIEVMRQQIAQFEIRGATALQESLRQCMARLMEIYPAIQTRSKEPFFKKLVRLVTDIGTLCENAGKAVPLLKAAAKWIPLITSGSENGANHGALDVEVLTDSK